MSQEQETLRLDNQTTLTDQVARRLVLAALSKLQRGRLVIREQGSLILCTGQDEPSAEINVQTPRFYRRVLLGGSIGAGESYVDGDWDSPDLTAVIRVIIRNLSQFQRLERTWNWLGKPWARLQHALRTNNKRQAKRNILSHYDLGNELYGLFLDDSMQYSSGLFLQPKESLEAAQHNKLHRICEQLQLTEQDHLLEIGTGWGGLAIYAARKYGCLVTTTTISDAQYAFAQEAVARAGLRDRIRLLNCDYRDLDGRYSKIVSVEMIEAVGHRYLPGYFNQLNRLLADDGLLMLQAITMADPHFNRYSHNVDFIQKHIFPGGFLPSIGLITGLLGRQTQLVVRDIHDMGLDYAQTLSHWRQRLLNQRQALQQLGYDERFMRLWQFYLQYCEGGFLERRISTIQCLAHKVG